MPKTKLSASMTPAQFANGYWYALELKDFAQSLGVPSARQLRKDELERAIVHFLHTGEVARPTARRVGRAGLGARDVDLGLTLARRVVNYTSNKETKNFIVEEAARLAPGLRRRSGARYRLNRWREAQLTAGRAITYRDLVEQYVKLNSSADPFERIPHGRYINFVSDFLAHEPNATHASAIRAWQALKRLDVPKDYRSWQRAARRRKQAGA